MVDILLRALSLDDLGYIYKWHSDEDLYQTLAGPFRFVSKEAESDWLQNRIKYSNQEINLVICERESLIPIGMVSVREIDWVARRGYLSGILIGDPQYRTKGYASDALRLMCKHCFLDLGLNKIFAYILDGNDKSLQLFLKCGFSVEGYLLQHAFKNGEFKNLTIVGAYANTFVEKK